MSDYDELSEKDLSGIRRQIDEGMRTINGDTAPVVITAREAEVLLKAYELVREVHPHWDHRLSVQVTPEQLAEIQRIAGL